MGNKPGIHTAFEKVTSRLEERIGKIPLTGRYHRLPRRIEDDYEVQNTVLGSGYNGVVRMATRKGATGNAKFAVKAFKLSKVVGAKRGQLEAEVEIFLAMDHPHVTTLFDVYESEDTLNLVMECMDGGELFDRLTEVKRFSERDAADSVWQMLLALNYLHSHGIVHRDLKLENFLYDCKGSNHLKLIDFGFSKMWDPNIKMHASCGTLSYIAPEVLRKCYTSQCDLWSLGVITFILLSGYMPFSGEKALQTRNISEGHYFMKPERWKGISEDAKDITRSLLQVSPEARLTAQGALDHPWMAKRHKIMGKASVDIGVANALRQFGHASRFRRCCMEMMAWSLSNDERNKVREQFLAMDTDNSGTITMGELRTVLQNQLGVGENELLTIFSALDSHHDEEIHYSDFLAAMVSTRIELHDDLLWTTFQKFDTDHSGYITASDLREILGDSFEGAQVDELLAEADVIGDHRISYAEFVASLTGKSPRAPKTLAQ